MPKGMKWLIAVIFALLIWGASAPWQGVYKPLFWGFIPAGIFYLILVHLAFVAVIGLLAFKTRFHGRIEDEQAFLAELKSGEVNQ